MNKFHKIMIDITTSCSLRCPVCYREQPPETELPLRRLEEIAGSLRGKIVLLCGGEPTERADLPAIIRLFSRHNTVFLVTNGLKLADAAYLAALRRDGLKYVSFSFNGFSDDVYRTVNGEPLLDRKLAALAALKKAGVQTVLALLLARGVNEDQLQPVLDYCLANRDFIQELRIRTMSPVGRHLPVEGYQLDELLEAVCRALRLDREELFREQELKRRVNDLFGKEIFPFRDCSFDFHLRPADGGPADGGLADSGVRPVCAGLQVPPSGYAAVTGALLRAYGLPMLAAGFLKDRLGLQTFPWIHSRGLFKVGLRAWPGPGQVDPASCRTGYWHDGTVSPFCEAIQGRRTA